MYAIWRKYIFSSSGSVAGSVQHSNLVLPTRTIFNPEYIYTEIKGTIEKTSYYTTCLQRKERSSYKRQIALVLQDQELGTAELRKNAYGVPTLRDHSEQKEYPISITHHGNYFALLIKK